MSTDRYLVVTADTHAGLRPGHYREYIDPPYHERYDEAVKAQLAIAKMMSESFKIDEENQQYYQVHAEALKGAWDHDRRVEVLEADGIVAEVIFPDAITESNSPPFGATLGLPVGDEVDPELQWVGARAHNRWLAELCQRLPGRRIGVMMVPACWDIEEAVKEVRWARENGSRAIMIPGAWGSRPPYNHPFYEPLWAVCDELEIVIHVHGGAGDVTSYFHPTDDGSFPTGAIGCFASEAWFWTTRPLTFMIWGGVFDRYPRLKYTMTEASSAFLVEYTKNLDDRYRGKDNGPLGDFGSHLKHEPSEYIRKHVGMGCSLLQKREVEMRYEIGIDKIMWGSDYPHPEGTFPHTRRDQLDRLKGIPDEEIAAILGANAIRFYGFDEQQLRAVADRVGPEKSLFQ